MKAAEEVAGELLGGFEFCRTTNTTFEDCPTHLLGYRPSMLLKSYNPSGARSQLMRVKVPPPKEEDSDKGLYYTIEDIDLE